jgi:hypothetical protein
MKIRRLHLAAALAALLPALAHASCGAAFCTVNTNWTTQNALLAPGSAFDVHYEYIDQDQPRAGGDNVAVGQIHHHHDEVSTVNRNLVATYSRGFGNGWGLTVTAPLGDREHRHVHNHHGEQINETWSFTELGDIRVLGRRQLTSGGDLLNPSDSGVTFGLKLPTGRFTVANDANDRAERSLQPGTGTTDLILGAYHHQRRNANDAAWFVQAQYQHAVDSRAGYKPGAQFSADVGVRKGFGQGFGALVQLNFVHKRADSGSEAEPADSGGRYLFLSPGLSYAINGKLQVYGFVQQPLVRHVNGVQLTADRSFLAGLSGQLW